MQAGDAARERRLAGARLADERDALAGADGQLDVEQHLAGAVRGADAADGDERVLGVELALVGGAAGRAASDSCRTARVAVAAHRVGSGDASRRVGTRRGTASTTYAQRGAK